MTTCPTAAPESIICDCGCELEPGCTDYCGDCGCCEEHCTCGECWSWEDELQAQADDYDAPHVAVYRS